MDREEDVWKKEQERINGMWNRNSRRKDGRNPAKFTPSRTQLRRKNELIHEIASVLPDLTDTPLCPLSVAGIKSFMDYRKICFNGELDFHEFQVLHTKVSAAQN